MPAKTETQPSESAMKAANDWIVSQMPHPLALRGLSAEKAERLSRSYESQIQRLAALIDSALSQERQQLEGAKWLVWSNEHHAWWCASGLGYTSNRADAGRYSLAEAVDICERANGHTIDPNETIVKE